MNSESVDKKTEEFTEISLDEKNRKKLPKRRVYFSDGYLDEYSTDEEVEAKENQSLIDPSTLTWLPYIWYLTWWFGSKALSVCDYLGEHLANFLGITTPKFQYEIEQHKKLIEEEEALRKHLNDDNAGWLEKGDEVNPIAMEPVPTKVVVSSEGKTSIAKVCLVES